MSESTAASCMEEHVSSKKPTIAVLMGGKSAERDVSLVTGEQVAQALESRGYSAIRLDIDDTLIPQLQSGSIDCVFIALHGRLGEDGTVQGMLEVLGVPYTGSGVLSSALAMDKVASKKIFVYERIPTPDFVVLRRGRSRETAGIVERLGLPLVVKPSCEGSAIGVSVVRRAEDFGSAIAEATRRAEEVLIEEHVAGTEITVGVLENGEPEALPTLEIVPANEMYDYEAKYTPGMSEHIVPARISEEARLASQELAVRAHRALGCEGFSRVDFIVTPQGEPFALEVNTIPGMTGTSLFPEAAKAVGIEFPELIERIVVRAMRARSAERA